MSSLILRSMTRALAPALVLFSLFLLWRGHHEPGGGFLGGLIGAGAFSLVLLAFGRDGLRQVLRVEPRSLIGVGLLVAISAPLVGWLGAGTFFTALWGKVEVGAHVIKLGTPLLFDVGVYVTVTGFLLTIVEALDAETQPSDGTREASPSPPASSKEV